MLCAAASAAKADGGADFSDSFQGGKYQLTLGSGVMFSPIGADHQRPQVDYTLSVVQFGWMLSDVKGSSWYRGNWEMSLEAMGGTVFKGEGSYMAGGTLLFRYNFVQAGWRVVPFVAAGGGAEATNFNQDLLGENFNFNLDVVAGVRCFLAPKWALDLECRYQHLSNATIANHDIGINAVGPMLGLSYFF